MGKIKVLFYVHEWTYGGTARSHYRIIEALDRTCFEPYVLYWPAGQNDLLPGLQNMLGPNLLPFDRSLEKTGPEEGYRPLQTNFAQMVKLIQPDIIHFARSGYYEWPFVERLAPLQIESNVFGERDTSGYLDKSIAICHYIAERRGGADAVIYNPIPPAKPGMNLRDALGIPKDAIVCGRIGRPANFHPIALDAFSRVVGDFPNLYYVIIAPCRETKDYVERHEIPRVIFLPPTADDAFIESFYRTLDIFAHYRADGECHSTAIAQAMMYGIPILSHNSDSFNGQKETIGIGGFVLDSVVEYANLINRMASQTGTTHRTMHGYQAKKWALENYEQSKVVRQIEAKYTEWSQA